MLYFSKISSLFNKNKYKRNSDIDLINLRLNLELYIHWKTIYDSECEYDNVDINNLDDNDKSNDVYEDLLEYIKVNIFNKNNELEERYDKFIRRK